LTIFLFSLRDTSSKPCPSLVEATFQVASSAEAAAVLQCGPITRTGISNINLKIKDWGDKNKDKVFKEAKDAKKLGGFLVVTAVYKTRWCRTRCWSTTSLKSYAQLKSGDGSTKVEASFQFSTETEDKSGFSFPAGKVEVPNLKIY
jgi:hypothetical protein